MSKSRASGTVASIGYASGPLFILSSDAIAYVPSGVAETEADRLRAALSDAAGSITALMQVADEEAAGILEFQIAMLDDESLAEPALAAIAAGANAADAWSDAMATEIQGYEAAEDTYFRARGSDLRDIAARVLRSLSGVAELAPPQGAIIQGKDLTPTQFLAMDWTRGGGIVLKAGSPASHVAMLARSRGVPMLVGVSPLEAANDDLVLLDAEHGNVVVGPDAEAQRVFTNASAAHRDRVQHAHLRVREKAVTADGVTIDVLVNIAQPADVRTLDIAHCDGVGLMRTEFLFGHGLPDEATQYAAYRTVLEWAGDKPVTIRTVDAGGDKPVPGYTVEETNPFLGLRGIRLSLSRPDVFRVQARALLRAAVHGNLKVMFPMVSLAREYAEAARLFEAEAVGLAATGIPHRMPPLGIMVEVPAVAISPEGLAAAAFFSVGSNDLTQYVMAAGRDNNAVARLNDVRNPAVIALIGHVARFGAAHAIPVSLCGDAGGDPAAIPALLAAGIRALSVTPAQLPLAKATIAASRAMDTDDGAA
jgi:phosphotransferase system enzyme I (PtsI)